MLIPPAVSRIGRLVMACGLVAALAGGCSSNRSRVSFTPSPAEIVMVAPGDATDVSASARGLVAILGAREADAETGAPATIDVRVRLDNTGNAPVVFDPASLQLIAADLREFGDPALTPFESVRIPPGGSTVVDASFPFPSGEFPDLSGLHVRLEAVMSGFRASGSATFARRRRVYAYPRSAAWGPGWGWGYGRRWCW